ncbi:hypothetical protein CWM58_14360 [Klebsiella sp. H-Nf2]|uniref:AAA family ATPase n=1 Tax=Klebsiella sp. H-Nf2 TaxID=2054599 RepID=UPI000C288A18|nr:ATP-binding protein [Klebsiella sp. H-Nf2]PJR49940.1 hypothetical protein CWM58_14360 [Klebsiella sp. H-Nf2]
MNKYTLVKQCELDGRVIDLAFEKERLENYFSVIVGRNGSGKSRLLSSISIEQCMTESVSKTICLSNTLFHKFISHRDIPAFWKMHDKGYRNKCLSESLDGHFTLSDTFANVFNNEIIQSLFDNDEKLKNTLQIFHDFIMCSRVEIDISLYSKVGLFKKNEFIFDPDTLDVNISHSGYREKVSMEEKEFIYENLVVFFEESGYMDILKRDRNRTMPYHPDDQTAENIMRLGKHSINFNFDYGDGNPISNHFSDRFKKSLLVLNKYRLITVNNISFIKHDHAIGMKELSSGELSVLLSILKINSEIEENSVILMDEPEVSLHPAWQKEIIPSLERCFSIFKGCHFIIATHSPQVVAGIPEDNSSVLLLDDGYTLLHGRGVRGQSSDFQLFNTLNYAGGSNEYIKRRSITIIAKIDNSMDLNEDDNDFIASAEKSLSSMDDDDAKAVTLQAIALVNAVRG